MRTAVAFPEQIWHALVEWLDRDNETAGVLLANVVLDADECSLFVHTMEEVSDESYELRSPYELRIRSTGWVPIARRAEDLDAVPIFVHSHPNGRAHFSTHDDVVDEELRRAFPSLAGARVYGSIVIGGTRAAADAVGRVTVDAGPFATVDVMRSVGDGLAVIAGERSYDVDTHDRQIRLLGRTGQAVLQALHVGVVGAGGTGSPVFEQLVRLGVGHITVIDDDVVTPSTVARGFGTTARDVGRPKVEVLEQHARSIGFGTRITAVHGNVRQRAVIAKLEHCDAVFCCVDGHAGRLVLNRWAYWHLAPVIDIGVLVSVHVDAGPSVDGRVTWLSPGTACLLCRGRIDPHLAYAEQLSPDERRELAQQGYVPGLEEPEPSVVSYTTTMAGLGVTELLNRLYGLADPTPTELIVRLSDRRVSLNRRPSRPGCFCGEPASWGQASRTPYLDLVWER